MGNELKYYYSDNELKLESGQSLSRFTLAYHTYGQLNAERSNVIWIIHALTGDSDPQSWWPGLIGPDLTFDTNKYFIICANSLGSHYGSTNPLSINSTTGSRYYHSFPEITNRDIVSAFIKLSQHLKIESIHTLVGPSLGGQQALEWSIMQPHKIKRLVLVATNAQHSPYGIAFNESQRMAIRLDSSWSENKPTAGIEGMKVARSIALISYRTKVGYDTTQPREGENQNIFRAASYQRYQGDKLAQRFNAYSYYLLSQAMDSHDVGAGRGGRDKALSKITAKTTIIGLDSDILFPIEEQKELNRSIPHSSLHVISSDFGHDGFLTETAEVAQIIKQALAERTNKTLVATI